MKMTHWLAHLRPRPNLALLIALVLCLSFPMERLMAQTRLCTDLVSSIDEQESSLNAKRSSSATHLAFQEVFQMPFGPKGLSFTPKALALNGQCVSMVGYMVKIEQALAGAFILSPRPVEINDHADGEANDLPAQAVWVRLDPRQAQTWVPYRSGLLRIQGVLDLGREELPDAQVSWIRIHLDQGAVRVQ